ncbi:hypothetical protein DSECCO2_464210 [anaerobic digester metagenome]
MDRVLLGRGVAVAEGPAPGGRITGRSVGELHGERGDTGGDIGGEVRPWARVSDFEVQRGIDIIDTRRVEDVDERSYGVGGLQVGECHVTDAFSVDHSVGGVGHDPEVVIHRVLDNQIVLPLLQHIGM